jgi:hypothetical protein
MWRLLYLAFLFPVVALATDLQQVDGTVYRKVRVTQVDPDGLVISHEKGVAKVDFAKLSPELQQRYSYSEKKAALYRAQETRREARTAEEKQRLLKEYEERELARIQKLMEAGATGDELIYGNKGTGANSGRYVRQARKEMELREEALELKERKEREPRTFWTAKFWESPVVQMIGAIFGGKMNASGHSSSGIRDHGDGADFSWVNHLKDDPRPPAEARKPR